MEKLYLVTWEIDLYASSPEEAARKALSIQRDTASIATVFMVQEEDTPEAVKIDLTEIDETAKE